jgi:type I protein arginine methyltransferase
MATHIPTHDFSRVAPLPVDQQLADEMQLGQYIPLHYHYNMLLDSDRVDAFKSAIACHVQADMHVLELGGGTGILSSFAARRGARVTCVERNPALVAKAREALQLNGLDDRVEVIQADAAFYTPERPVDVVICEMLHAAMLREKQLEVIAAFKANYRRRFAERLPIFIPEASVLLWQAIEQDFDFAGYWAPIPLFRPPLLEDPRVHELSPLEPYACIDYCDPYALEFDVASVMEAKATGCWNAVRLATQNVLALDMSRSEVVTWPNQCMILPLAEPLVVEPGERLRCEFRYRAGESLETLSATLAGRLA